jgi:hypothetical protein
MAGRARPFAAITAAEDGRLGIHIGRRRVLGDFVALHIVVACVIVIQ